MLQILKNKIYVLENMLYSLKNKVNKSKTTAPYKVYTALLSFPAPGIISATEIYNDLGIITWSTTQSIEYIANCQNCFTPDKTTIDFDWYTTYMYAYVLGFNINLNYSSDSEISFDFNGENGVIDKPIKIEIKVYK